jgi:hypothetical protein
MAASRDTVKAVSEVVWRHVSELRLRRTARDMLDVPANASFRETIRRVVSTLEEPE